MGNDGTNPSHLQVETTTLAHLDPGTCRAVDSCHLAGSFNAATGTCGPQQVVADGTSCDDGDACTVDDICRQGVCVAGVARTCTGGDNACSVASCDPASGCQVRPLDALCSTTLAANSLNGCWYATYGTKVSVGGSQFNVQLDTGSNMLALAGALCTACSVTSPLYALGVDANIIPDAPIFTASYGDGSNWTGFAVSDLVQVAPSVPGVRANVVYIADTNQTGQHAFFEHGDCTTAAIDYTVFQGIMGMGGDNAPGQDSNNMMAALQDANLNIPDALTVQLCERGGSIWYGGYDRTRMAANPQWIPMQTGRGFYDVEVDSISVNGTAVDLDANSLGILDTGSSLINLPSDTFTAVTRAIENDPNFLRVFGATFLDAPVTCAAAPAGISRSDLDAMLPRLSFQFTDVNGKLVHMDMAATHSYLTTLGSTTQNLQYCSALTPAANLIIGDAALQSHVVVFDRANKKAGISPQLGCPAAIGE